MVAASSSTVASSSKPAKAPAPVITKRLHISGLSNPAITHADLRQRFASFGTVEAVDGVGLDGNGPSQATERLEQ